MTEWQKVIKYLAIVFAVLLCVSIIVGICSAIVSIAYFFGDDHVAGEMQSYTVSNDIRELEVDISAADFVIRTGDTFRIESNLKYLTVEERDGRLSISETKRAWGPRVKDARLELYVPEGFVFQTARITTGAGRLTVDTLSADVLRLELGAGEVRIGKLTANRQARIDGGAGAMTVEDGLLRDLDLQMGVGELKMTARIEGTSQVDHGVGAVKLVLLGTADDYRITLDKGLGEATIDGKTMSDDSVYGSGEHRIEIDGGVGAIKITFRETDGTAE